MKGDYYWDRAGEPMGREDWITKMSDDMYKRVALDTFPDGTFVSTVWLGLDHSFGSKRPIIFESMIFGPWVPDDDEFQWRYSSEMRARDGHRRIVQAIECGASPDEVMRLEL